MRLLEYIAIGTIVYTVWSYFSYDNYYCFNDKVPEEDIKFIQDTLPKHFRIEIYIYDTSK
jgi:hypothetical protein